MSIDWVKAEENPEKKQKVSGNALFNLRKQIVQLEKEIMEKAKNIEYLKEYIADLENKNQKLKEKSEKEEQEIEKIEKEALNYQIDISKLDSEKKNIEAKLKKSIKLINQQRVLLDEKKHIIQNLENMIDEIELDYNKEIRKIKDGFDKALVKNDEKFRIKSEKLKEELDEKRKNVKKTKMQLKELKTLQNQMDKILKNQGFVSDKNLAEIRNEIGLRKK